MVVERLAEYIDNQGLSYYAFENAINASRGSISKAVKQNKNIGSNVIENILSVYENINPVWLITGKGNMLLTPGTDLNEPSKVYKLRTDRDIENQKIPLYNLEASAGLVSLFDHMTDQTPIDFISIPNLPKCDGALTVTGDSMYPLLKSGDIVAYKEIQDIRNDIFWGEMYLISIEIGDEEFVSVKWIQKSDKGETYIKLVSENQHHQSKDIPLSKVRALAIIKASIRINSMR
ncbi:MAG: S24 family peptidase [Leeuwenhoekiella sp.]